jgi:hypothetical protein
MGLLDSLFAQSNQGGYGGLLDFLQNSSPLLKKEEEVQQPQYDAMGNSFGQASIPQTAPDPFGPIPNMPQWAQQFAPKPQLPFNVGAAPLPGMAPGVLQSAQPQQPQPAPIQPPVNQVNDIGVGGYQMPRMGSVADYTPRVGPTDVSAQSRQPQMPAEQPAQSLPPAMGGAGSVLGRIGSPDGLIARLTGNDSRSEKQQNLKAQYDALVPVLGQQKAMLAVMNPEAGKILLAQALEKKKFGFHKMDDGTLVRTDEMSGKADLAYGETTKQGTLAGPDGKPITIPEGLDAAGRKTFINEIAKINADAAGGKKTGEQATAEIFANKMELSNKTLASVASQGSSLAGKIASGLPMGNYLQSTEYQKYKQAASNFITALLRKESGAAIGKEEFDRYDKEYMPQPGDSREVLVQKSEARQVAIDGMKKGAGPGYKSPTTSPGAVRKYNPATGTIE